MSSQSGAGSTQSVQSSSSGSLDSTYPEQHHAGKVGYGPNFRQSAGLMDKISGLREEIHGKLAHKPELVKEGHEKRTGEAKRRKALGLDEDDPFGSAEPAENPAGHTELTPAASTTGSDSQNVPPSPKSSTESSSMQPEKMSAGGVYSSGPAAREEAATVTPQDSSSDSHTARMAHARSQGMQSMSEAQERPQ